MDSLKDFYDFYRPLQRRYNLQMIYKTNSKEAKITIRWRGKELVKVAEETTEACFNRTRRELEERMKKYENGKVYAWNKGTTSWSGNGCVPWGLAKLSERSSNGEINEKKC